ncbi:hypothetical protein AALP_AA7G022800 [Arabis alpina]|uniref:Protein kinase domain-containing protein n=1 Tax=Arabis alpina TaxID=50452 RepID=A0A087GFG6_ARAAL|nr:hypothetical protein AALP_AA7G022800 [Arabis alpina]
MKTRTGFSLAPVLPLVIYVLSMFINGVSSARKPLDLCNRVCGGISIPYPFGIGGKDCYLNPWYEVVCNSTTSVPFLPRINRELVNISLPYVYGEISYGVVRIKGPVTSSGCSTKASQPLTPLPLNVSGQGSPFFLTDNNILVAVGCNVKAVMTDIKSQIIGCESSCDKSNSSSQEVRNKICNGHKCCQTRIPEGKPQVIGISIEIPEEAEKFHGDGYAVVELGWYFDTSDSRDLNPIGCGCVDIDECKLEAGRERCKDQVCVNTPGSFTCEPKKPKQLKPVVKGVLIGLALLLLVMGILSLYRCIRKEEKMLRRKKFFRRNGGLLLKKQLARKEGHVETSRIFSSKELEKATDSFNKNRVLGQGGQGTVYKGMLVNGRIVAVKMSEVLDEDKVEEFINEVVVLSQINHRNIVKLLGCCLETKVPTLVYEFVPNGNLFERLHDESDDYKMTWEVRLHIAIEIAGAISYLHSAASLPIYHRDIKTTNILLDGKYRVKVSDFGTSRSVTIDQTHLTTQVAGTFGYVDPEYFQSNKFTDKSDVYSFGVVLVELLTGGKPFSRVRPKETRGFAAHFVEAVKEKRVLDIVDVRIKDECNMDQVMAVAKLATRCLNRKGKKRPNMREVSIELQRIRSSPYDDSEIHIEEDDDDQVMDFNIDDTWDIGMTASASMFNNNASPTSDVEPLVPLRTW